jgi:hypothetical protein
LEWGENTKGERIQGAIVFFPRGIGGKNLGWISPPFPTWKNILKKFCVLSLTYRRSEKCELLHYKVPVYLDNTFFNVARYRVL